MAPQLDSLLSAADRALRALLAPPAGGRPVPPSATPGATPVTGRDAQKADSALSAEDKRESAALMRVNHAGEMAAQALYHAQALFARDPEIREFMLHAAREETDHLAWCETRLKELGGRPSVLNPLWYAGSFGIGALAALLGDRASLGFVAETERQVEGHLKSHLERLPAEDLRSRAIVEAMCHDEVGHGQQAQSAGAATLPGPVRELMRRTARIMTHTSYRL
ncbi:MAG TPA: 2-polyprenyl-3-methyl-6-methoxy-1,4-benzoquinone monooxygenase [Steroidobacteraceae bacterium]|nr:2-polyprenyl-3-methyl-6-methoxy-1,4-benzoquinone monooxygenase [Steroidobacteraceae bacterium]